MTLTYQENNYEPQTTDSANSTEKTQGSSGDNTERSHAINKFLLKSSQKSISPAIEFSQKQTKTQDHYFHPTQLKNPNPSNAFVFVIMISIGTILLPFIPIAANYLSQVMESDHHNHYHNQLTNKLTSRS